MHKAAADNNSYLVTYLRDVHGFSIESLDQQNNTPLHHACFRKSDYTIMWLISFGANVNAQNSSQETPLHTLLKSIEPLCDTKIVKELIFRGVKKDLLNRDGKTALEVFKDANEIRLLQNSGMSTGSDTTIKNDIEKMLGE